jgi:NAD(P) transhydrogenase subunit alpha
MAPGSVVVDLGASELGGNVVGSVPDRTVVTPNGVTVVGAGNLASDAPAAASAAFSRNVCALLAHLVKDGSVAVDLDDEIQAGVVVTHGGAVVHPATRELIDGPAAPAQPTGATPHTVSGGNR